MVQNHQPNIYIYIYIYIPMDPDTVSEGTSPPISYPVTLPKKVLGSMGYIYIYIYIYILYTQTLELMDILWDLTDLTNTNWDFG